MLAIERKEDCCGCQACAQVCPKGCITMERDEEGFFYPAIDKDLCVNCGLCEKVCPMGVKEQLQPSAEPEAYAAYTTRENVRRASSSGGVFTLLAESILAGEGAVYGAAMTSVDTAEHIRVSSPEELHRLRGSKYVQSRIGNTYRQVREDLRIGKTVLFTGTPCQIGGLKSFLGKDYPNLICMDFVCHGVPSETVWSRYVRYREKRAGRKAVRAEFRNKKYGWKEFSVVLEFSDGSVYTRSFGDDPFMRAYLHDLSLRPSCYDCAFKGCSREADITVADFWGIQRVDPEMDDDQGTSLLLIHSQKGQLLLQQIRGALRCRQVELTRALQGNPAVTESAQRPQARERFLEEIRDEDFRKVVGRYVKIKRGFKRTLRTWLRRWGLY